MENKTIQISAHLKGQFLRLYQMAASDGDFSSAELEMLYEYALSRGVSKDQLMLILATPVGKIEVPEDLTTKVTYLYDLAQMIWADGKVDEDEIITLKKYATRFGFLKDNIGVLADYLIKSVKEEKTLETVLQEIKG
jgi:DnaJ-domain-containing protein 1